jgi:hypothetical protein
VRPRKKPAGYGDGRSGQGLSTAARQAERTWRAHSKEAAALPPEELRPTRAERRARLELQAELGDERAKERAVEILRRARDNDVERERLRNRRKRPHKHLPTGLVELPFVVEVSAREPSRVVVTPAKKSDRGARVAIGLRRDSTDNAFVRVTPELARDAASLRAAFDVQPYDDERFFSSTAQQEAPMMVRSAVAEAIRVAAAVLDLEWSDVLIELATDAIVERVRVGRKAANMVDGVPPPAVSAPDVHRELAHQVGRHRPLPADVDVSLVAWVLEHLALGAGKGGRNGKLRVDTMRATLRDPRKLARAMGRQRRRVARTQA